MTATDNLQEGVKAIPPLAVTGMTFLGFPMSDWVLALTAIYTVMQIALLMRKTIRAEAAPAPAVGCSGNCPLMQRGGEE